MCATICGLPDETSLTKKYAFVQFGAGANSAVNHIDARFVRAHRAHPASVCCARVPDELPALLYHIHGMHDELDARALDTPTTLVTAVNDMLNATAERYGLNTDCEYDTFRSEHMNGQPASPAAQLPFSEHADFQAIFEQLSRFDNVKNNPSLSPSRVGAHTTSNGTNYALVPNVYE